MVLEPYLNISWETCTISYDFNKIEEEMNTTKKVSEDLGELIFVQNF